ncbi:class I SAM-dependent methyltransferase, partial [Patescibacteria group bacterium]|nr:class I SAM-dependent methyltransferase [Patescibacteria group bacterium]
IAEAKKRSPNLNFLVAEMTQLPIEDNSFDVIYTVATFHHLSDDKMRIKALEEMKRVLKPGGKIIMTNWNLHNDWVKKKIKEGKFEIDSNDSRHIKIPWRTGDCKIWGWRNYWSFTMDELKELFETAGFEVEEQYFTADKTGRTDIEKGMNVVTVAVSGKQSKL